MYVGPSSKEDHQKHDISNEISSWSKIVAFVWSPSIRLNWLAWLKTFDYCWVAKSYGLYLMVHKRWWRPKKNQLARCTLIIRCVQHRRYHFERALKGHLQLNITYWMYLFLYLFLKHFHSVLSAVGRNASAKNCFDHQSIMFFFMFLDINSIYWIDMSNSWWVNPYHINITNSFFIPLFALHLN